MCAHQAGKSRCIQAGKMVQRMPSHMLKPICSIRKRSPADGASTARLDPFQEGAPGYFWTPRKSPKSRKQTKRNKAQKASTTTQKQTKIAKHKKQEPL